MTDEGKKEEEKKDQPDEKEKKVEYPKPEFHLLLPKDGKQFDPFFHCVE